jgi:6-phosphofructokinase 1
MRIGVFCSGGDAPGMNACVRGVVRAAVGSGHEVAGIRRGYQGLLEEDFFGGADGEPCMPLRSVSDIARLGGTILRTSRCKEFVGEEGQQRAAAILDKHGIEALVPIGGDGTFRGAVALARFWSGQIVGCPGTIDNDLLGTDFTIGFSTAVQTAVEAVDKIRDTAESHERMFLIEVMGRHSGYIAVYTALATGAEFACVPETPTDIPAIVAAIHEMRTRGKTSIMMIVAEGDEGGSAEEIRRKLEAAGCPFPTRAMVLGHLQRGGSPAPEDRILGAELGAFAVRAVLEGKTGMMAGKRGSECVLTPLEETFARHREIPEALLRLLATLSS